MNFKTVMRMAKLSHLKKSFFAGGYRVANADNYIMVWSPSEDTASYDKDDQVVDDPDHIEVIKHEAIIKGFSPPADEMIKVNSDYLRRAISAIETKGNNPVYLSLHGKYICLAYDNGETMNRAIVMCMRNE